MIGSFRNMLKKPINIIFLFISMILMSVSFIYVYTDQYDTFENQNRRADYQVDGALLAFEMVDTAEGSPVYQNLALQKREIAKQLNSVLFEKPDKYIESGNELAKLREELRKEKDFNHEIEILQPPLAKTKMDSTYFTHVLKTNETVYLKPETFSTLSLFFFSILGIVWFPVCAFLTANMLEDEYEHESLLKGLPESFLMRCLRRYGTLFKFFIIGLLGALFLAFGFTQLFGNGINDLGNSQVVQLISFTILKNWQVMLLYIFYLIVLFTFVFTLSIFLNVLLRNFYLTLILEMIFYALTILLPEFISESPWYLGAYLIPTYLLEGRFLMNTSSTFLNPIVGMGYLLMITFLLLLLISLMSKRGLKGVKA